MHIRPMDKLSEAEAKTMFAWLSDPDYAPLCTVCKDPNESSSYKSWLELQQSFNSSKNTTRFGIYDGSNLIGEFNFVFDHPVLIKSEPKTAFLGIGIGLKEYRGRGIGTMAIEFLEIEVAKQGGKRIELGVFEYNHPAIRLYQKLNYRHFHSIPDFTYWQGEWWTDMRFEKYL